MKEYDLYIPMYHNDGVEIALDKIEDIQNDLIDEFKGLTAFSSIAVGYWRDDSGLDVHARLYEDQNQLIRVVAEDNPEVRSFMLDLKSRLQVLLEQECIFIVVRDVEIL